MIKRVTRKIKRMVRPEIQTRPSSVSIMTYLESEAQFYLPTLVGPSSLLKQTVGAGVARDVLGVLERLSPDIYLNFVTNFYRAGLKRFGDDWVYADINTVLLGLAHVLQPTDYLEIGVRRGRSLAMVLTQVPCCAVAAFDMWIEGYAGMENPGKQFVREEMTRIGYQGDLQFFDGDSKETVPQFFKENPNRYFDLITVDGDHSLEGARRDLLNVLPYLKVGGVLVFDDISNQSFHYLDDVWNELIVANTQYSAYSFKEVGFGVGFAIKKG